MLSVVRVVKFVKLTRLYVFLNCGGNVGVHAFMIRPSF